MHGQLLIKGRPDETLDAFVACVERIIGPLAWEEHESTFYIDDRYFLARAFALELKVSKSDWPDFEGYEFWISISSSVVWSGGSPFLDGVADGVARALCVHGYEVLRPNDLGKAGNDRGTRYRLNPSAALGSSERIQVDSI